MSFSSAVDHVRCCIWRKCINWGRGQKRPEKVIACTKLLTDIENEGVKLTPVVVEKFPKHIADREKTVLRKLIQNARRKTMRISNKSVPPRLYFSQSETVNSILAAKKCVLGYGKTHISVSCWAPKPRNWKSHY